MEGRIQPVGLVFATCVLGFVSRIICCKHLHLLSYGSSHRQCVRAWGVLYSNKTLSTKQVVGQVWPASHGLLILDLYHNISDC